MSTRIEVLERSLEKKERELDRRFDEHFASVRQANGQPLNDKRNGQATFDKWERQNNGIRTQKTEIEKTKRAIEREQAKLDSVEWWYEKMPKYLTDLIDSGKVKQWRKHPRMLFVEGVEKARLVFDDSNGLVKHRYAADIPNQDQYAIFRDVFNAINAQQQRT